MVLYYPNVDPVFLYRREKAEYISLNETLTVKYNRVTLKEVPDFVTKVSVKKANGSAMKEVTTGNIAADQYRVDYSTGMVYFHSSAEDQVLTISYKGTGGLNIGANRLIIDTGNNNNDLVTIQDILDSQGKINERLTSSNSTANEIKQLVETNQVAKQLDLSKTVQDLASTRNIAVDASTKASNPLAALKSAGYKISLDDLSNNVKDAMSGTTGITTAKGSLENNRDVDYPLKNATFRGNMGTITDLARKAVLDVKIFGAKVDCLYKLDMISNGFISNGQERYGITLTEYRKSDFSSTGFRTQYVFIYNDDTIPTNNGNANYVRGSDGVDTITVDNGEIACSVTVDRQAIAAAGLQFLNLGSTHAPSAIVHPSNYFF